MKNVKKGIAVLGCVLGLAIAGCGDDKNKTAEVMEFQKHTLVNAEIIKKENNFANQDKVMAGLEAEVAKNHKFDKPFTVVDPFSISPLTAMAIFTTDEPSSITVEVKGLDQYTNVKHSFKTFSKKHMVPIYGLYADKENKVELTATTKDGKKTVTVLNLKTDVLPGGISKTKVKVNKKEQMAPGLTFVDCPHVNANYVFAVDANGDIRWCLSQKKYNGGVMLAHLKNGNMLVSDGEVIPKSYNNVHKVFEISPLGRVCAAYDIFGIHHDIRETKNGNLIVGASKEGRNTQNDYIVEVDRKTGKVLRDWDLKEILPMTEHKANKPYGGGTENWFHNNAICYLEDKNEFVVSGRHQNTIAKFDANTKKLKWVLSKTIGEKNEKLRPYLLKPVGDNFEFPTAQHAATQLPDGKIACFDNTNFNIADEKGNLIQENMYSRAVVFDVDEKNMTVKEVWQYGKERGREMYSSFISDVDYLGENHYLIDFGGKYVADNGDVFDHIYTPKPIKNKSNRYATLVEIKNNEVIWEIDLYGNANSNMYKAERKDIYQGL